MTAAEHACGQGHAESVVRSQQWRTGPGTPLAVLGTHGRCHRGTPTASIWCHATAAERVWWGGLWAERILHSRIAEQAVARGHATSAELAEISAAWQQWSEHPDGWFALPHGGILCHT